MHFPVTIQKNFHLKDGPWSKVQLLPNGFLLLLDDTNCALCDPQSGRIYHGFNEDLKKLEKEILCLYLSSNGKFLLILLQTNEVVIFCLISMKICKIVHQLPQTLKNILEDFPTVDRVVNEEYKISRLLGIQKNVRHDFETKIKLGLHLDYTEDHLLVLLADEALLLSEENQWFSFDLFEETNYKSNVPISFCTTFHKNWILYHYFHPGILLMTTLDTQQMKCQEFQIKEESNLDSVIIDCCNINGGEGFLVTAQNYVDFCILTILHQSGIKIKTLKIPRIISTLAFTFQNNFIICMSENGSQMFIVTLNGDLLFLSTPTEGEKRPRQMLSLLESKEELTFMSISTHMAENHAILSNGQDFVDIQLPTKGFESTLDLIELLIASAIASSLDFTKEPKRVTFCSETMEPLSYEFILKEQLISAKNPKTAMDRYADSLTLLMSLQSCPRRKLQQLLKKILTGVLGKYFERETLFKVLICIVST